MFRNLRARRATNLKAAEDFILELTRHSPLLPNEARYVARRIRFDGRKALEIVSGGVYPHQAHIVPHQPRESFFNRLVNAL